MSNAQQMINNYQPDDRVDYQRAFHHNSMLLLMHGYKKLISSRVDYSNWEEPDITGEFVRCTNEYIDDRTSPEWTSAYAVHEESPENTMGRTGKRRKKVDVVCRLTQKRPHLRLKFEAKRLNKKSHQIGIYLGKEGLQEFITGNYARESDTAGMLGYIQTDNCDYWIKQLSEKLAKEGISIENATFESVEQCFRSIHDRSVSNGKILIYHLLLDFTSPQNN